MSESNGTRFRWIGLAPDGNSVELRRYQGEFQAPDYITQEWFDKHADRWRVGVVVDVETTGMSAVADRIIEIGVRSFRFDRETGAILSREEGYSALEDPGVALSPEIVRITGITDEMLAGQKIDWERVGAIFEKAHVIVAHNASFDRPFVDRRVPVSASKVWACSFRQIDWRGKGFPSQKLEILSIYHGFFCTAHRALADADSVLHLLGMLDPVDGTPYLREVLKNARRPMCWVHALQSPVETKDLLKRRGYRWNPVQKVWSKLVYLDERDGEVTWMTQEIYGGNFRGLVRELALCDSFKADG